MVFGVHVAVGAGAGYSIELGVEALSGLSEVMILANLMSRLTWPKKQQPSCKDSKVHVGFHCARNSRICFVDKALKKATSWGTQLAALLVHLQNPTKTRKTGKANQTQTHPISEMLKCRCMDLAQHA